MNHAPASTDAQTARWRTITLVTLFSGYTGYYICRSNFSIATPLILDEFAGAGITKDDIGMVASVGVLFYAIGKISNGLLADWSGGRRLFLLGMFASVICTVLFGLAGGLLAFGLTWAVNRYVQSMGWVSLVKVSSRWYPVRVQATVMGILSMSYLLGDAFARFYLGSFLELGFGWRDVFFISAGTLGVIAVVGTVTLKASPKDIGAEEPEDHPENLYRASASKTDRPEADSRSASALGRLAHHLGPLLRSPLFWLICAMNFGLTLIRETFNFWTPTFLNEAAGIDPADAALGSFLFPLVGSAAALAAGVASDRLGGQRGLIVLLCLLLLGLSLVLLGVAPIEGNPTLALVLIAAVAFFLLAPYSYYSGVMALDLGGRQGSATASGLIDSAGYLGAILSGFGIGKLAEDFGWSVAFGVLAGAVVLTAITAIAYWVLESSTFRRRRANAHTGIEPEPLLSSGPHAHEPAAEN